MTTEVRWYAVTIPAGTAKAAPLVSALTMPARIVSAIRLRFPPGPRGMVGVAIGSGGQPVIPWNSGAWIVADDETIPWPLDGQIESGAWQLIGYNLGTYDHTIQVGFELAVPGARSAAVPLAPLVLAP